MSSFKYSFISKKGFLIFLLGLMVTSLFAYVVPISLYIDKEVKEEKDNPVISEVHPLTGVSDNMVPCFNDGSELHEIYLCGANAERVLNTNIPDLKQITWSKKGPGDCGAPTANCPNTSTKCTWDQLSTDTQLTVSEEGEYRIYVRYNDNSAHRYYFNVYSNGLSPNAAVTNIDCGSSGSITINNVPSSYEYSINSGASWQDSNFFPIDVVGTYDIQIRSKSLTDGCVFNVNDVEINNNSFNATSTIIPITCKTNKGGIQVDILDASTNYIYEISQGGNLINSSGPIADNTYTFSDLDSGTYNINVTLSSVSNCSWAATETVPVFQTIQPNAVATKNIDCTDGVISVVPTGGTAPFEYSLDNGSSYLPFTEGDQTTINISTAGAYTIRIKDSNECETDSNPINVIDEPEITYTLTPKDITCNSTDDGSITVDVTNSQGSSITYSKDGGSNFQTSNVFSNLTSGSYTITIRKEKAGNSCDLTTPAVTIGTSPDFIANATVTQQIDCANGSASIDVSVTAGGTAPFEFSLNGLDYQTSSSFTGLGAGTYTLTVKDTNGCTTTVDQPVDAGSNPSDLTFLTSGTDCSTGETDVQVTVQNGKAPFTYRITDPTVINAPGDTFTALPPNTYTFEVTADDGCKIVRNFIVPNPVAFSANAAVKKNVSCFAPDTADGSIEINVSDFNTSFDVVVEDSAGVPTGLGVSGATISPITISGLIADTYTIKINDASGPCQQVETIEVKAPSSALSIDSFNVSHMNCGSPGSVTIEASGGWNNYAYSVRQPDNNETPPQANKTITGLDQPGTYTLIVADINGCILNTQTFDLEDKGGPTSIVDASSSSYCYSTATKGELKIDVTDGDAPYFYTVNNGTPMPITGGTFTLSNLTPDDYVIKVIGNNGCEAVVVDTKISGQLFALAKITKPLGCGTIPDAIIDVTPEEGYPPYSYTVNGDPTPVTMPYNAATEGLYTFTVTDDKGCSFTTEAVDIKKSPPLDFTNEISNTTCGMDGTGAVKLKAQGGTPPYQYAFSATPFSATNQPVYGDQAIFTGLDATTYYFGIKDDLGCTREDIQTIVGAEAAMEAVIEKADIQCDPAKGGNVWGNMKVSNITNATGLVTISLIRIQNKADYEAGNDTHTWTYRRYENIDLTTDSNYLNATSPSVYGSNTGFDIRLYWASHFVVRVEDEKGCLYESPVETVTAPTFPNGTVVGKDAPICADGASFDFKINDDPALVGPFEAKIWPYDMIDSNGDGIEDDITNDWRPFDDTENPAFDSSDINNERDYRFTNSSLYGKLLFGVHYYMIIRDTNTGCVRWRSLGIIEPPSPGIAVDAVPQSIQCTGESNGQLELNITGAAAGNITYKIFNASNPKDAGYHYGNFYGNGHTVTSDGITPITFIVPEDLRVAWYVVEVEDANGCSVGERFLIYRPKSKLQIEEEQVVQPTCNIGGQVAVSAIGGWDDEKYFNIRNKLYQNWHPYEYALVLDNQTPTDTDFGPNPLWTNVVPAAYDGVQNVYRAYVRDGSGCVKPLANPITFTKDPEPIIDTIDVTDRCTPTNEVYHVVATLTQPGTNPATTNPIYIWDGEVTNTATKTLGPGQHTLEVRDENGCSDIQNIHIYPQLVPKSKITKTVDCDTSGLDNGEMLASAYGGSGNFEFTISPIPASYAPGEETNKSGEFTRLEPGVDYIYTVNDLDNTCGNQDSQALQLITPVDPQFEVDITVPVSCYGDSDGKIIIKQIAGVDNLDVNYEYRIDSGTYQTSNLFEGLIAGPHDVTIRSAKNCEQTITGIIVGGPAAAVALSTPTISPFTCTTDNKLGMATIETIISGGTAPYKYSYNGNSFSSVTGTTISFDVPYKTTSQNVIIDVIDVKGCPTQITAVVPAGIKITANIVESQLMSCADDAIIDVMANVSNYQTRELPSGVLINGTGNGPITIPAGNPGTYVYELTDTVTGCTTQVSYVIAPFDTIEITANNEADISCFGNADGELSFEVTDYGSGFTYEVFNVNDPLTSVASCTTCTSASAIPVNTLEVGTFYVEATSIDTGCKARSNHITIQSPSEPLDFSYNITHELTCTPGNDAQITATPKGGWGNYEFELVDPSTGTTLQAFDSNNIFSNLTSGINYEITVRDAGNCANVMKVCTVPAIDPITVNPATISVNNPSCTEADDGSISVIATRVNGHTNYQYILNNITTGVSGLPQMGNSFNGLIEGEYSVTVTDGYGCDVTTAPIQLIDPSEIKVDGAITQEPTCTPDSGEITVSAVGGGGTYDYRIVAPASHMTSWSGQQVYSNLAPGTYEFLARDAVNFCVSPISILRTINAVEDLTITVDETNTLINCFGEADAVLIAEASGGLGGYQYQLEVNGALQGSPQDSGTFENLGKGNYRIVTTSGVDCEKYSEIITISEPPLLTASVQNKEAVKCFGEGDGSLTISVSGGKAPYQYIISSEPQKSVDSNIFENLAKGTYSVIVQDVNNCEVTLNNITIDGPTAALEATISRVEDEVCSSDNNGLIELEITGGTAPYKYNLVSPTDAFMAISGSTLFLDNLDGGFYQIFLKDANECPLVLVQEVKIGSNLSATVTTKSECLDGQPNYSAVVEFEDTEMDMTEIVYDLDDANPQTPDVANSQITPNFSSISAGNHTISIVHLGTGCVEVKEFTIEAQDPLVLTPKSGRINEIVVEASGGDGNYNYYFNDVASGQEGSYFINHTNTYIVKVIDGKGCETSIEIPMEFIDIEIPNFFTPDGDGVKDIWVIDNWEAFPDMYVSIFDRYGRTIKEWIGQGDWNGSYKKTDMPSGDYWYIIKLNGPNDEREFVGHFTVYR